MCNRLGRAWMRETPGFFVGKNKVVDIVKKKKKPQGMEEYCRFEIGLLDSGHLVFPQCFVVNITIQPVQCRMHCNGRQGSHLFETMCFRPPTGGCVFGTTSIVEAFLFRSILLGCREQNSTAARNLDACHIWPIPVYRES